MSNLSLPWTLREREGDIIDLTQQGHFDVLVHGCNCFCTMNAGLAKQVRRSFPFAWQADQATRPGDRSKLGTFSMATENLPQGVVCVVNAYIQYDYRGRGDKVVYDQLDGLFGAIARDFGDRAIAMPCIGAGLAGGDWPRIRAALVRAFHGCDLTVVHYAPEGGQ